ncbi:MAG: DNA-binding protein [Candidatus Methanogaster sp.]|uniref:DNA-binding protein n=1 Tax=Candidatus Methanogaster sp. TaxID=3386292 RepID=A0AC61L2W5_9EURY|nr:MAG: DNA-binding protein [ANME-2 cluster archaeon]
MKIILDTNALMVPAEFGVDIFSELDKLGFDEWLIPPGVARELKGIASRGRGKGRDAARVALSLMDRCRMIETAEAVGDVDDSILELAVEMKVAVFTNDAELKGRLRERCVKVVYLRQRSYLVSVP